MTFYFSINSIFFNTTTLKEDKPLKENKLGYNFDNTFATLLQHESVFCNTNT